jgi:hypothetical protein
MNRTTLTRVALIGLSSALFSTSVLAEHKGDTAAWASVFSVAAPSIVVLSPLILAEMGSNAVVQSASEGHAAKVAVQTKKGEVTVEVPADAATKAKLKQGDALTVKPGDEGAMLMKGDRPVVFLMDSDKAPLTNSTELKR